jgi:hypothetical protein
MRIYLGPQLFGPDSDLAPVTFQVEDVNGDHHPDLVLHFQGSVAVFINEQEGFRPLRLGELVTLPSS